MVRTAATAVRTGGAKSAKGAAIMGSGGGSSSVSKSRRTYIGGNKPINRPIPGWQKPISNFFGRNENVVIQARTFDDNGEHEEEVHVLEPPDWQKPVSDFLSSKGPIKKHDKDLCAREDSNLDQVRVDDGSQTSETDIESNEDDKSENRPCCSGESSKRLFDDINEDDENPAKRTRQPIDYKMLEEYEKC